MTPEEAQTHKPRVVVVDEQNNPKTVLNYSEPATSFSLETGLNVK
jgi:aspartate 1-decarboxylase